MSGWSNYWSYKEESKEIWDAIKKTYPDKAEEFIYESMTSGVHSWQRLGIQSRISQLVKYLLSFDLKEEAFSILETASDSIVELTSSYNVNSTLLENNDDLETKKGQLLLNRMKS